MFSHLRRMRRPNLGLRRPSLASSLGALALAAAVLGNTFALAPAAHAQGPAGPVKIGLIEGFTSNLAIMAVSDRAAVRLAIKEINASGGLLGRPLELVEADNGMDPAKSVTEARRLVKDGVTFVLGPEVSFVGLAVAPVFDEAKVVTIGATVSPVPSSLYFSSIMSVSTQTQASLHFAAEGLKAKNIALLVDAGPLGQAALQESKKLAPQLGLNIVATQVHEVNSNDLTPQLLTLKRASPDVLLHLNSVPADGGQLIKNLSELSWEPKVISLTFGLGTPNVMAVSGPDSFKGGKYYGLVHKAFTYCRSEPVGDRPYDRFLARLKASEPADFDKLDKKHLITYYDALMVLKAAVESTKTFDGPTVASWIEANGSKMHGVAGNPIGVSPTNHYFVGINGVTFVTRPDLVRPADKLVERDVDC